MRRYAATLALVVVSALDIGRAHAADPSVTAAFARADSASHITIDHSIWADLLKRHVQAAHDGINRFDYAHVSSTDRAILGTYLSQLQKVSPSRLSASEQHAYWINFYNALTVKVILDHYPVASIRDIASGLFSFGPWDMEVASVEGHKLTLNNIEHDILRADWHDSRVHYALNCASLGCPNLQVFPYAGRDLDTELDAAARAFINHPRGVTLHNGHLIVSEIYRWYGKDFGGTDVAIIMHLRKYASPELAQRLSGISIIDTYQYDWHLNAPNVSFAPP